MANERKDMIGELARLEAERQQLHEARKGLRAECGERAAALCPALDTIAEHPDLDEAGFLGSRYHQTVLAEHRTLDELARRG